MPLGSFREAKLARMRPLDAFMYALDVCVCVHVCMYVSDVCVLVCEGLRVGVYVCLIECIYVMCMYACSRMCMYACSRMCM